MPVNMQQKILTISTNQKTVLDFQQVCHFGIGCSRWSRFSVAHTFRQTVIQKCDLSKARCFQLNYYLYCLPRQLLYFHPRQKMLVLLFFESDSCHNLKGSKTIKVCSFLSGECHYRISANSCLPWILVALKKYNRLIVSSLE